MQDSVYQKKMTGSSLFPSVQMMVGISKKKKSAVTLLERVKHSHRTGSSPGTCSGPNTHNISCTVTLAEDEWEEVEDWSGQIERATVVLHFCLSQTPINKHRSFQCLDRYMKSTTSNSRHSICDLL